MLENGKKKKSILIRISQTQDEIVQSNSQSKTQIYCQYHIGLRKPGNTHV